MMTPRPIVSVLMLAYNHGRYIRDALQSIVQQEFDGLFEVLVGDDGSSDDTHAIAMKFAEIHPGLVKVVHRTQNVGMHANHEDLVARAKGQFIAYCEGDDFWHARDKLQRQVAFLETHPGIGAVHADFDRLAPGKSGWRRLRRTNARLGIAIPTGDVFDALLRGNFIQTCTLCVRTELVRNYLASGLPISSFPVGDWPLAIYVARHDAIEYMDRSLAVYRHVRGSVMNSGHVSRLRMARGYLSMIDSLCDHFGLDASTRTDATKPIQRAILSFAVFACDRATFEAAWGWIAANDAEYLNLRRRLLRLIARSKWVCRMAAVASEARQAVGRLWRYRRDG